MTTGLVFTNGCFDLLHVGHVRYLKQAKSLGSRLLVGLNSDESVKSLKGNSRPLQSENDRAEILLALESVDEVQIFSELDPLKLIQKYQPEFLVKGGDWPIKSIIGYDFVSSYGGQVLSLDFTPERSTTLLIDKNQS